MLCRCVPASLPTQQKGLNMNRLKLLLLTLMVLLPVSAVAADLPVKNAAPSKTWTTTSATGCYLGVNVMGVGSNLDIIGSGINGSVFAGGALLGGTAGCQLWNNNLFAAVEADVDYDTNSNFALAGQARWYAGEYVKLGMGIPNSFFNANAPITIPGQLEQYLISPYALVGSAERPWGTGFASGAGAAFAIGGPYELDVRYMHINYHASINPTTGLNSEDLVRVGVVRHF